ncbi:hypothetical protein PVAND_015501 [Polypedilum vanderplanki]|uniref:Uncharacterized protein n=1 Tax=Polypedilum vanderplanki TaxID=319348 RepID=A0A9J6BCT8_POLVA|nr:hypothetical protein PVAND_015501 [Polypedilum vanderplanki]
MSAKNSKIIVFKFRFLLNIFPIVSSLVITCKYREDDFHFTNFRALACVVNGDLSVTTPEIVIKDVTENFSQKNANQSKIQGFLIDSKFVNFMLQGLEKFFPDVIAFGIYSSCLKEIHQKDFENLPKLELLNFYDNQIVSLEKNLFKFNNQLQFVSFSNNKIKQIHPTVFKDLINMRQLDMLGDDQCVSKEAKDRKQVMELLVEMKAKCMPKYYFEIGNVIIDLTDLNFRIDKNNETMEKMTKKFNDLMTKLDFLDESNDVNKIKFDVMISLFVIQTFIFIILFIFYSYKLRIIRNSRPYSSKSLLERFKLDETPRNSNCSGHVYEDPNQIGIRNYFDY